MAACKRANVVVGLMVLAATARVSCQAGNPVESPAALAVRAVANGIVAADNARDIERVLASYAETAMLLPPNEPPVTGRAAIRPRYELLFSSFNPAIEGRIDELVVSGDLAYVRGHNGGWLRGREGRPDRALDDVYLMILERQGGAWRIIRLMWHAAAAQPRA